MVRSVSLERRVLSNLQRLRFGLGQVARLDYSETITQHSPARSSLEFSLRSSGFVSKCCDLSLYALKSETSLSVPRKQLDQQPPSIGPIKGKSLDSRFHDTYRGTLTTRALLV